MKIISPQRNNNEYTELCGYKISECDSDFFLYIIYCQLFRHACVIPHYHDEVQGSGYVRKTGYLKSYNLPS